LSQYAEAVHALKKSITQAPDVDNNRKLHTWLERIHHDELAAVGGEGACYRLKRLHGDKTVYLPEDVVASAKVSVMIVRSANNSQHPRCNKSIASAPEISFDVTANKATGSAQKAAHQARCAAHDAKAAAAFIASLASGEDVSPDWLSKTQGDTSPISRIDIPALAKLFAGN